MKYAVLILSLLLPVPALVAAPATAFIVQISTADTGVPFNFTVRAIDSSNNTDDSYAGTVHFTSSDGAAVLPADYTFTPADHGVHVFSATLHGDNVTHTISVTDTANASVKGLAGVYVFNPGLVTSLSLAAPGTVNREETVSVVASARNARGEIVPTYGGTIHFSNDKSATLPADYTFTPADAGSHTFSVVFHRGWLNTLYVADVASGGGGGIGDALAEVYVICPELTATAFNNGPICPGGVATISAQTNAASPTFVWQQLRSGGPPPGGWPTTQTFTTSGGTWEVIVTDTATGCIARAETTVSFEPTPVVSFPQGERVCENTDMIATLQNDPNGPYTDIVWSVTGASIVSGQGTTTITIRTNESVYPQPSKFIGVGVAATRSATQCRREVQVPADFDAQAPLLTLNGPDAVCAGGTARVTIVPGSDAIRSLQWTLTGATEVRRSESPEFYIEVTPTGSGPVGVTATYATLFGACQRSVTKMISVNGGTPAIAAATSVCANTGGHAASVSDAGPGATYSWTISNGTISSGQGTPSITWTSAGSDVQLGATVTANGCTWSTSKTVAVTQSVTIIDQPDSLTVASGSTATLEVQANADGLSYEWFQGPSGDMSTPVGSNSPIFTTPPLHRSTSYWVNVSSGCGSVASETALITVSGTTKRRSVRK